VTSRLLIVQNNAIHSFLASITKNMKKYDYVIVLCAWTMINNKFPQFLNGEYLGGQTRMDAAVIVAKQNPKTKIILVGGYNEDNYDKSDYYKKSQKTENMKTFMHENGVEKYVHNNNKKEERIITVESLPCTRHNLIAVFNEYKEEFSKKDARIGLLTNFYHLPRALNFWEKLTKNEEDFKKIIKNPEPIIAESFIEEKERYLHHCEYIKSLESELNGLRLLQTYKYNIDKKCFEHKYKCNCLENKLDKFSKIINSDKNNTYLLTKQEMGDLSKQQKQ
jgi:hypothetical protein